MVSLVGKREFGGLSCGVTLAGRGGVLAKVLGRCDVMMIQSASQLLTGCFYVGRKPAAVEMAVNSVYPNVDRFMALDKRCPRVFVCERRKAKRAFAGRERRQAATGRDCSRGGSNHGRCDWASVTRLGPLTRSDALRPDMQAYALTEVPCLGKHCLMHIVRSEVCCIQGPEH